MFGGIFQDVTLVVTHERSGFDKYSQELARRLDVPKFHCKRYFEGREEYEFLLRFRDLEGPVHITNQNFARYAGFLSVPYIVTIHDLIRNFYDFDHEFREDEVGLIEDQLRIEKADQLLVVSETTKKEVLSRLKVQEEKITVTYDGVDFTIFHPNGPKLDIGRPYILAVGSERPRKNYACLLPALKKLGYPLVKVGVGRAQYRTEFLALAEELGVEVIDFGFVNEMFLATLYRGAHMLVFPSLMEGFGLPLLEAMSCGCPVVASNIPSSDEVLQGAGVLVPPTIEGITTGISNMTYQRDRYIQRGLLRAKAFSWGLTVNETRKIYEKVLRPY